MHYQARDMAVVRGNLGSFPVVLASATPSIESHVNARTGRYRHVVLPGRYSGAELPDVTAIDLRQTPPEKGRWLSPVLVEAVAETLAAGQQSLLFLNRRGYAPLTLCRSCGHRIECPQCTAWLVEHRFRAGSTATTAASRCRCRRSAPSAASRARSSPAARASSASPRRWPSAFPRRASPCCRPTSCPA